MNDKIRDRLKSFQLEGDDLATLKAAGAMVVDDLDQVLDRFYQRVRSAPHMADYFSGGEQMTRASRAQKRHWSMLLRGDFSEEYLASASRVSRTHFEIELPFADYLGSYARVSSDIQALLLRKIVAEADTPDVDRMSALTSAVSRAFFMDIELVIDAIFVAQADEQERAFQYLGEGLQLMADGDLAHRVPGPEESDFPKRFDSMRQAVNRASDTLNGIITDLADTLTSLRSVANEVSTATTSLSQRTESQAASLEETAAAVHEVTQTVGLSVQNTDAAKKVAEEATRGAEAGRDVVVSAAEAMEKIEASSREIAQIVSMINDVAFQTNLLALNAGVEAARAGDAGRGFAVVASEVRALSERSTQAVKKIETLIATSSVNVASGVDLVGQAAKSIDAIVRDFGRVTELATEIAIASNEQSTALGEISSTVTNLDQVTQQNAAMVEETTAAGQILRENTERLADVVGQFRLASVDAGQIRSSGEPTYGRVA